MRESNTIFSLTYKSLKTGQPSYLRSSFIPFTSLYLYSVFLFLSQAPVSHRLKRARSFYHSGMILLLSYGTISYIIYIRLFITSLLLFQTRLSASFNLSFPFEWTHLFHSFFPSSLYIHLGYLRTIGLSPYWPSFVFSSHIHFYYSPSFTPIFMLLT